MIFSENKQLLLKKKHINELKLINHEKQLDVHKTFYKTFLRRISRKNQKLKNENNNFYLLSLLRKKNFLSNLKLFNIPSNYNSYDSYVTKMVQNAKTKYIPKNILYSRNTEKSLSYSNNIGKNKKMKTYFGLDPKTPLNYEEGDSLTLNSNNIKLLTKSPSTITYNKNENKEEFYTIEDDIIANKIFFDKKRDEAKSLSENNEINNFYEKFSIEKDLTIKEKSNIEKIMRKTKYRNKKNFTLFSSDLKKSLNDDIFTKTKFKIKDYENPYHSQKELKINSQIFEALEKMRNNLHFLKFQEQFNLIRELKLNRNKVVNIKPLSNRMIIKKMDNLKKENVINYFSQENSYLNKRKLKIMNFTKNYNALKTNSYVEEEKNDEKTYEEKIREIHIEIGYLGFGHHPDSRLMSSICYDHDQKKIYNYGGLGGILYGDLWECKFTENKISWNKIYNYKYDKDRESNNSNRNNNNIPLPRYGHTCHVYKKKIYVIGGEYKDWKKDIKNEDILWIYDLEKKEWISHHKLIEIKNRINLEKRNSRNKILNKLKKNFSDLTIKIPNFISPNLIEGKNFKNKRISKFFIKEEKEYYSNLKRPKMRRNHVSLLIGSHIFLYGGIIENKEILNDCWIYDINLCQWTNILFKGNYPPALANHCSCLALKKDQLVNDTFNIYHKPINILGTVDLLKLDGVFFFGGINDNKIPSDLFFHMSIGEKPVSFDIPNIQGKPPKARIDASMDFAQNINMIIIYGGKNELDFPCYYEDMTLLDLQMMNWIHPSFSQEKPIKRAQHLSVVIGEELIIFGGTTGNEILNYDFMVVDLNLFNK